MAWWDSPLERRSIQAGMRVQTQQGERLGRVRLIGREVLYVRPWRFSRREFAVPLARVARVTGGSVYVRGTPSEVCEPLGDRLQRDIPTQVHPLAEAASTGHAGS
ncbi:PRC-barrel domain containing protein [Hyalangium rubrum]|uniref:PRC-barrel domain containing protein n=1 Tax=Hyalangium rubrum TaxID=3103134 RepID=A0ABU5H6U6_9BACT|nr:PRC-barrel domain containing protein [Hyalangium sp. s54d21]MDY7227815.1 PRC-barrel domain containing protein [Hyalangium sp. s54d21]